MPDSSDGSDAAAGPLAGIRVVELGAIGPGPHAAMLLADLGADVVRIERPDAVLRVGEGDQRDQMLRNRRLVELDLKDPAEFAQALALIEAADVLLDGFRPGVAERLGLGPDDLRDRNPRLIYGRITGWGQDGPLAQTAGHDINYLALTGALAALGFDGGRPRAPLNLVADFGGGSLYLVMGVLAALVERSASGKGQVVDAAMVDGVASLLQLIWALRGTGQWSDRPGVNLLDGGAPFYDTYVCADGRFVAVGAVEPEFFAQLVAGLGWDDRAGVVKAAQFDPRGWPALRARLTETFATRTRDEWAVIFDGTDACVTPVLTFAEASAHPHLSHRETLVEVDGVTQAAPAPRFSRTAAPGIRPPLSRPDDFVDVLADWSPRTDPQERS
ncbi:CoA transferase [Microbacterium lacus]|uniref:CaiB/BaiF CoA transferase family protein n=1 Tax=Microbacterium lacus TaxID=415217 RepID=UPI00384EB068